MPTGLLPAWAPSWAYGSLPAWAPSRVAPAARHFNDASVHKSHGWRIDRDKARAQGIIVDDLEADQQLQEEVLTSYHLSTITAERGPTAKLMLNDAGRILGQELG